jgi:hypothetical protein
VIRGFP